MKPYVTVERQTKTVLYDYEYLTSVRMTVCIIMNV